MTTVSVDMQELTKELGPAADTPIGPHIGIASIALNMAMKYHDISTVQDGTLYQQYKLEGKNLIPIHLDMVFETAIEIEKHLIKSHKRITEVLIATVLDMEKEEEVKETTNP